MDCVDFDKDGDGVLNIVDCVLVDSEVYFGVLEFCNGLDDNCVLGVDEGFSDFDLDGLKDCVDLD